MKLSLLDTLKIYGRIPIIAIIATFALPYFAHYTFNHASTILLKSNGFSATAKIISRELVPRTRRSVALDRLFDRDRDCIIKYSYLTPTGKTRHSVDRSPNSLCHHATTLSQPLIIAMESPWQYSKIDSGSGRPQSEYLPGMIMSFVFLSPAFIIVALTIRLRNRLNETLQFGEKGWGTITDLITSHSRVPFLASTTFVSYEFHHNDKPYKSTSPLITSLPHSKKIGTSIPILILPRNPSFSLPLIQRVKNL